jgi:hypothetical protein
MKCNDVDKVEPLDKLMGEKTNEFDSGEDRACDKDLDAMIWERGDYENKESPQEAEEFAEEPPIEEELVEGKNVGGGNGRASFTGGGRTDEAVSDGVKLTSAHSLSPRTRRKR